MQVSGPPNINYRIVYFNKRPWWQMKYEVQMYVKGFKLVMVPDYAMCSRHWTLWGARRAVDRTARKHDFKVIDSAQFNHTND